MAEEPTTGQEPTTQTDQASAGATQTTQAATATADQASAQTFDAEYVKSLRAEAAKHRKDAADTAAKLKAYEDAQLSEAEKLQKQAKDASDRATALEAELRQERGKAAVARAAAEANVPAALAERLITVEFDDAGQVKTDLKAAIAHLLKDYPQLATNAAAASGSPTNPARSGAGGGSGETDAERRKRLLG